MRRLIVTMVLGAFAFGAYAPPASEAVPHCEFWRDYWYVTYPDGRTEFLEWIGDSYLKCVNMPTPWDPDPILDGTGFNYGIGYATSLHDVPELICTYCKIDRHEDRETIVQTRLDCDYLAYVTAQEYCVGFYGKFKFTGEYSYAHCQWDDWLCAGIKIYETNPHYTPCLNDNLWGKGTTSSVNTLHGSSSVGGSGVKHEVKYGTTTGHVDADSSMGLYDWCHAQANEQFTAVNVEYNECRDRANKFADDYGTGDSCL